MNSTIVYNLRNRAVYSTVFDSFLDGIISFLENYKEFLTQEHSLLLQYLKYATYVEGDHIKSAFRALLNYVEIYFEQSKKHKYYSETQDNIPFRNLIIMNESIYCFRANCLKMKYDLYKLYQTHVDPSNTHINKFLNNFKLIKHNIDVEYDDAQIMLDSNIVFGI
jgi:hypothetical protein